MKTGTIYLIPSAIAKGASQNTVTPHVKEAILSTKFFVAEHAREARRFISSLRLGITIEELIFSELNKRTSAEEIFDLLRPAFEGNNLGILSDAGCPGIEVSHGRRRTPRVTRLSTSRVIDNIHLVCDSLVDRA